VFQNIPNGQGQVVLTTTVNEECPDAMISPLLGFSPIAWVVVVMVVVATTATAALPAAAPPILFASAVALVVALPKESALAAKIISNASFSVSARCSSLKPTRLRASLALRQASIVTDGAAVAGPGPGAAAATSAGAGAAAGADAGAGATGATAGGSRVACTVEQVLPVT